MIYIGPSLLSGIGQALHKLSVVLGGQYTEIGYYPKDDDAFIFALPVEPWFTEIPKIKQKYKRVICMTICETETVHEDYGKLFKMFDKIAVPSEYCINIFKRQFPDTNFKLIRLYVPPPVIMIPPTINLKIKPEKYVFYHIGNIIDPRKNINMLIRAFIKCDFVDAVLVLKATCNQEVHMNFPNIHIINGLLDNNEIEHIHQTSDCYISCSFSEGVGLGAVEAACRNKPVIISEYGGATEYIKTPYIIKCGRRTVENNDFLFKKGMEWGDPDENQLMTYMKSIYLRRARYEDGWYSRQITSKNEIVKQIIRFYD